MSIISNIRIQGVQYAIIESWWVLNTSCLDELIYDLINRQLLCGNCLKPETIQYLHASMLLTSVEYYESSRWRFGQRSSLQQLRTSASCIGYNNGPYLLVMK